MPTERRGATAEIHGHVEDLAAHDPHELPLRIGELVVEPAQHVLRGEAVVVLHEVERPVHGGLEPRAVEALEEEAARVGKDARLDDQDARDRGLPDVHEKTPARRSPRTYSP